MATVIKCKRCGDIIWSSDRHDMVWCRCHSVAIDGGDDYCKISGNIENWEYLTQGGDTKMKIEKPKMFAVYAHYRKDAGFNKYIVPAYSLRQARVLFKKHYPWLDIIDRVEEYTKEDTTK